MDKIIYLLGKNTKKIFKIDNYDIHYKTSPFDICSDDAIYFDVASSANLDEGLNLTINSIKNNHNQDVL